MDSSENMEKTPHKKRKIAIVLAAVVTIVLITGIIIYCYAKKNSRTDDQSADAGEMMPTGGLVSATGTTTTGMISEELDLDYLETSIYIEEVYLHQGDTVEAGTEVFKISDDSLEEAKKELERAAESADYTYRAEVISAAEDEIDAKATLDKAQAKKEYASQTYDDTIRESQSKIDSLQEEIDELNDEIEEYTAATESNYYYTYYDIDGKKEQLVYNFAYLNELYDDWNIKDLESSGKSSGGTSESTTGTSGTTVSDTSGSTSETASDTTSGTTSDTTSGTTSDTTSSTSGTSGQTSGSGSDKLTVYNLFDAEVTEESEEYEKALDEYEEKSKLAAANLATAQAQLEQKQAELAEAQTELESVKLSAKTTYDETVAECDQAQETYDTEIKRIEDQLDTAKSDYEDAQDNLEYFNEKLGDGYFYTSSAGDVMMIMAREDENLSGTSVVMAYTDADSLSVEVSVDQSDIASLSVGESAMVSISGYDNYQGKIIAINPESSSTSKSSVTYTVTVSLEGDISKLSENLTATVMFGVDETDKEAMAADEQTGRQTEE